MVEFVMVRLGGAGTKYNIYKAYNGTADGKPVYKNVTYAEGLRICAALNEWNPNVPSDNRSDGAAR